AGDARARTASLASSVGLLRRASRLCASRRWRARLRGARLFTVLGGGLDDVPALFDDRHPLVRAQAAEWASDHPRPDIVARLVAMLDDEHTLCRFTVRDSLLRIGRDAVGPLAEALDGHHGAAACEALRLAAWMPDARFLDAALRLSGDGDATVRAPAAAVLGGIGGEAAQARLVALLADPDEQVRANAAAGLGRLEAWTAAAPLSDRLRDPSWGVRSAAAGALRRLGGPGEMLLERALRDRDPFAADMARHVLSLREVE
ncbi:MAG TPA: HEAT repeat domain-containing protein, partial [Capillimicrobium sp.]